MADMGRPSKWDDAETVKALYLYIMRCVDSFGGRVKKVELPSVEGFAADYGISKDTVYEWAKEHEDFSDGLARLKAEQAKRLLNEGLSGNYNPTIAKLILSSNHGYRDQTGVGDPDGKPLNMAPVVNVLAYEDFKKVQINPDNTTL